MTTMIGLPSFTIGYLGVKTALCFECQVPHWHNC